MTELNSSGAASRLVPASELPHQYLGNYLIRNQGHNLVIPGFEDVIGEPYGGGHYYNVSVGTWQLVIAIRAANHAALSSILESYEAVGAPAADVVGQLRKHQVLESQSIIDLGCGMVPGFALAAIALGEEVHTADGEDLPAAFKNLVKSHTAVDLNSSDAPEQLLEATGGKLDLVTENVVDLVPLNPVNYQKLKYEAIASIAGTLLRTGGYLHANTTSITSSEIFQKVC